MFKRFVFLIILLVSVGFAQASTLNEPGYSESLLANVLDSGNSFGSMAIDAAGNIYIAAGYSDEVFRVTPAGVVSQFGTTGGTTSLGIGIIGDTLYVGFDTGEIRTMDLTLPAPNGVVHATVSGAAMGMAIAPAGFGAYGGQLVIGTYNGISIVHPITGAVTQLVVSPGNPYPDLGFTQGGDLVAVDYDSDQVVQVSDTGTVSVLNSSVNGPDGMAIHPTTGEIFVASSDSSQIVKIAADGLSSSVFASSVDFDGGWYVSPIRFSADGTTLYYGADAPLFNLYEINGFSGSPLTDGVPVPAMSAWALIVLVLMFGLVTVTRKRQLR